MPGRRYDEIQNGVTRFRFEGDGNSISVLGMATGFPGQPVGHAVKITTPYIVDFRAFYIRKFGG